VDEAIAASEVVKGQYRMTLNPAYNSPNPVDSRSFTTVGLTQSGPMVVDLENTFISTDIDLDWDCGSITTAALKPFAFFVGWKSSVEAIERYDIMVNSTPIYTQSFTGEESFIQYQTINDMIKHTSPFIISSFENAKNMSPNICGTYIIVPAATAAFTNFKCKIPVKIPISSFLCLRNIKYLMSWMGKWEIRLYFSQHNLVVLPITNAVLAASYGLPSTCAMGTDIDHFVQFDAPHILPNNDGTTLANQFKLNKMTMNDVTMNSAQFQIRTDVMELLKQKYLSEKPLTFPVNTFQISRFTGPPASGGGTLTEGIPYALNIVLCQAINNCDTLYILPFNTADQHTCCYQPYISGLQLHAGEYGSYPTQPFNTYWTAASSSLRFVNNVADGINVNSSNIVSFNRDVAAQFVPKPGWTCNQLGQFVTTGYIGPNGLVRDTSNFFIPFPFSTDDDFQGGLSSPASNINFKLTGMLNPPLGGGNVTMESPWVACFLIDGVIMIRPDPGSDAAKVIWSDRTVA
jgi:hypothetical protein